MRRLVQRRHVGFLAIAIALGLLGPTVARIAIFPSDRTPEGAYLRVAKAVTQGRPEEFFAYLEEEAQHACYTIADYRKRSLARVEAAYPEEKKAEMVRSLGEVARLGDGPLVFAYFARREGWLSQLRRDLSAVKKVEAAEPRATVVTVQGTRYAFRRRPGGIFGMTAFTPFLRDEAERVARDHQLIEAAARDYEAARQRSRRAP
jgi:hypothetical protein